MKDFIHELKEVEPQQTEENKRKITKALLPVLQMTRAFKDLEDLEYLSETVNNAYELEWVTATFANGHIKTIDVTSDSGIALIQDVIRQAM